MELRDEILNILTTKANLKQRVFDNTFAVFGDIKEALHELSTEVDDELDEKIDKHIRIEYRDKGKFEAQLQLADDVLIFAMHTDVFQFPNGHKIWGNNYVVDENNAYCGVINIYNFLSDSFKYNRSEDEGYLIGRLFVNREMCFFAEGKRQTSMRVEQFGTNKIDRSELMNVLERAINYSLGFNLLVPPYDDVKKVSAEEFNTKFEQFKLKTGKRLGYDFRTDDI